MADESKPPVEERDPNYKKKMQWFGLGAVGLLCLTLIMSTFVGTGKRRKNVEPQPLPIDQAKPAQQEEGNRSLEEQIEQARIRRQRELEAERLRPQDPEQRLRDIEQGRAASQRPPADPQPDKLSVEEEFRKQEKRRALLARRSKFGLRSQGGNRGMALADSSPPADMDLSADDPLAAEQRRVAQELQRLEQMQGQAAPKPFGLTRVSAIEQNMASAADPREEITVGRPASEAAPRPGQKLIPTGTVISAVLDQELMSDYAGPFRGMITHDVYDVSGNFILIPKGSRITGQSLRISNVNEPIQARMGLTVRWTVLPNGKRISFERRAAALDRAGVPAIKDQVNYHFMAQFLGVAAYAVLSSETSYEGSGYAQDNTFEGNLSQSMREQFAPLAAKYLNLVPTITLRIGTPMKIFLEDDIYAYPWQSLGKKLYQATRSAY